MVTVACLAATLQPLLTTVADAAAHESGMIARRGKVTGATFVPTTVYGWLGQPEASLSQLCQVAAAGGLAITPPGPRRPLHRGGGALPQGRAGGGDAAGAGRRAGGAADPAPLQRGLRLGQHDHHPARCPGDGLAWLRRASGDLYPRHPQGPGALGADHRRAGGGRGAGRARERPGRRRARRCRPARCG